MATISVQEDGGGDYTNLADACTNANASDTINIEGEWDNADTSSPTAADDNLTIITVGSSRHAGYVDDTRKHYRLKPTSGHALTVTGDNVTIDGLEIKCASTTSSDEGIRWDASNNDTLTIKNCLIYANDTRVNNQDGIYWDNETGLDITIENCMIWNFSRAGIHWQNFSGSAGGDLKVNSCKIWNCGRSGETDSNERGGIAVRNATASGDVCVFNTICVENDADGGADFHNPIGSKNWNIDRCVDSDGSISTVDSGHTNSLQNYTATDSDSPGSGDWVQVEDITTYPYDLRLKDDTDNDVLREHLDDFGVTITMPTTDIVGTSRPQKLFSRGAHEPVVSDPATGNAAAFLLVPRSIYPVDTSGRLFGNIHEGAGSNSKHDGGIGIEASLDTNSTWRIRFQAPPSIPASGTPRLRLRCLANATAGRLIPRVRWAPVGDGEDPSSATLNDEGAQVLVWASGDADDYKDVIFALDETTITANEDFVVDIEFTVSGVPLAAKATVIPSIYWD